jgi:hypothetical protein
VAGAERDIIPYIQVMSLPVFAFGYNVTPSPSINNLDLY